MDTSDFPAMLANPARRALADIGCYRLEDLTKVTEKQIRRLHGIGPKALDQLRSAFRVRGLAFAGPDQN